MGPWQSVDCSLLMASAVQSHQLSPSPAATHNKRAKGGGRPGQERGGETLWWGALQGQSNLFGLGMWELAAGNSGIIGGMVQGERTGSEYRGCCN